MYYFASPVTASGGFYMGNGVLPAGITSQRGSVNTAVNASGNIASYAGNVLRPKHNHTTGVFEGWLFEDGRPNNVFTSNSFTGFNGGPTGTYVTSPDGTQNAAECKANAGLQYHYAATTGMSGGNVTGKWTFSVFLKPGTISTVYIGFGAVNSTHGTFNLTTNVVSGLTAGYTGNIENYPNGWKRCSISYNFTVSTALYPEVWFLNGNAVATGTETFYMYGAQVEWGVFPTSYIPTTAGTINRGADWLNIPLSTIPWNPVEFTIVLDVSPGPYTTGSNGSYLVAIESPDTTDTFVIGLQNWTSGMMCSIVDDGVWQGSNGTGYTAWARNKIAVRCKSGQNAAVFNGVMDANAAFKSKTFNFNDGTSPMANLRVGKGITTANGTYMTLHSLSLLPFGVPDADLIKLGTL